MKRFIKSLVLVAIFVGMAMPSWGQASPSTEGRDFWVTFLRAADDDPTELKLTFSALEACDVTIENPATGFRRQLRINDNAAVEVVMAKADCYSSTSETPTNTALHVTSTKDISLFAGNYRDKSFDATNVLPTAALLDDYLIQTYPPSDHENKPQGSHFAIIAVEDGQTTVDYNLTARTQGGRTGAQSVTLNKGQVYYVWTGTTEGDAADLSGTTVKARNGKKIAVFQGCPHTNIPYTVRDRDHIVSQAMPLAYWGSEFGITASRMHRRDIVAVMAINDGTQVYINSEDGEKVLVHTFDFTKDKKHYWTFEIGEELAYCADNAGQSPTHGKLPEPLIIDSSCYISTSCPAGVHLFMVSNRYDNQVPKVSSDTLVSDPAMLWISPIEQVIKEINFATYHTQQAKFHFMNILTTTADVANMKWNGNSIAQHFHPLYGNPEYSYARIEIPEGHHHLKGNVGFLAHVYGYGQRESYAYSCGSSTIQRSVTFNGTPLMIDSIYPGKFCVNEDIQMKLNIGNNDYESIVWDYGDGITYSANVNASNDEKKKTSHIYTVPGWYDLKVSAVYVNPCTNTRHNEEMHFAFRVVRPDTIRHQKYDCVAEDYDGPMFVLDTVTYDCDSVVITGYEFGRESSYSYDLTARDGYELNGRWYTDPYQEVTWIADRKNAQKCDSVVTCRLTIVSCLDMNIPNNKDAQYICPGDYYDLQYNYVKGNIGETHFIIGSKDVIVTPKNGSISLPTNELKPGYYQSRITVQDTVCDQLLEFPIDLAVFYPSNIFKYKFNNVLAVYNKANNGGYEFVGYQWYRNGEAIQGATESVYHTEAPFTLGDVYFVVLTDKNGMTLPSCSQTIETIDLPIETQQAPPATKHLINRQIIIRKGEQTFNIYGQRVQ